LNKYDQRIDVRVDGQMHTEIKKRAVIMGLSVSSYVRMLIMKELGVK